MLSIRIIAILSTFFLSGCLLSGHAAGLPTVDVEAVVDEADAVYLPAGHKGMWVAAPAEGGEVFFESM